MLTAQGREADPHGKAKRIRGDTGSSSAYSVVLFFSLQYWQTVGYILQLDFAVIIACCVVQEKVDSLKEN